MIKKEELKVGERVTITLEVVEQDDCEGNEIWEGDIVERVIWNRLYNGLTKAKGVIEYKGAEFFVAINSETYSLYPKDIKVVSNKFDK